MTNDVLVPVAIAAISAVASGTLMMNAGRARLAGLLLVMAGVVAATGLLVESTPSAREAERLLVASCLLILPTALWAYPRPRFRAVVDVVLLIPIVVTGCLAVLRPDEEIVFLAGVVVTLVLVAVVWWKLETEPQPWRGALVWAGLAAGTAAVVTWTISFVGDWSTWSIAVIALTFATIPAAMALGILRPQLVDARGIAVGIAVVLILATGYVAAFSGTLATLESLTGQETPSGVVASTAFVLALGIHPASVVLRSTMDRMLFGERPDPLGAASSVVVGTDQNPQAVLDAVREAMSLPYLALVSADRSLALRTGQPVAHEREFELPPVAGLEARLIVGLRAGDLRLLESEARALRVVAQLVLLLDRSDRLSRRLQESRQEVVASVEDERRRLRRELHDELGPRLSGLAFTTDAARNLLDNDPDAARELLTQVGTDARKAIETIRSMVYAIRPPALDDLGLMGALRQQASVLRDRNGAAVDVSLEMVGDASHLPAAVEVAVYRIVVESLTNVARHAPGASAAVTLSLDDQVARIEVRDHGAPSAPWVPGVGLASMRERAAEVGGSLRYGPSAGGGCVLATLPVK